MPVVAVGPDDDVQGALDRAAPGDVVLLRAGTYTRKLRLAGRRGSAAQPITVRGEPGAVLDGGLRFEAFNRTAMDFILARVDQDEAKPLDQRRYPGLHDWLLPDALPGVREEQRRPQLAIQRCAHVRVEGLKVRGSWPAAITVVDSPDVALSGLTIKEGTYAIHARGRATRGLVVERCSWVQDVSRERVWSGVPWSRMHDGDVNPGDSRAFDGDFLQAVDLGPGTVVRHCRVEDAFNGIHFWNEGGAADLSRDVAIHDNTFLRVRDNVVEPEVAARNWWVYRNRFVDCHKWLSLELRKGGGHFYAFGNLGWFTSVPGTADDCHRGGGVLKLDKKVREDVQNGPWYLFHNSWLLRSTYARAGRIANLLHANNAIHYARPGEVAGIDPAFLGRDFFGDADYHHERSDYQERERFTTAWHELGIRFAGDVIRHREVPDLLHEAGYPADLFAVRGEEPFARPGPGEKGLRPGPACLGRAEALDVALPDGRVLSRPAGGDVGAFQGDGLFAWPELEAAGPAATADATVPVA